MDRFIPARSRTLASALGIKQRPIEPFYLRLRIYGDGYIFNNFQIEGFFNEMISRLTNSLPLSPAEAKILLYVNKWDIDIITIKFSENSQKLFIGNFI